MKLIKIFGILVLLTIVVVASVLLYYSRLQTIDFSSMLGNEIKICNKTIDKNHSQYIQLKNWLHRNQTGWKNYPATQAAGYVYGSNNLSVNVGKSIVVINYGELGNRVQVFIKADTKEIIGKCD